MSRVRRTRKLGRLVFFIPVVAIALLLAIGLVAYLPSGSGTLIVEAVSTGRYAPSIQLHVAVTVGTSTQRTPANFTLPPGYYNVAYGALAWYVTPSSRSITVSGGKAQYAIGFYSPVIKAIKTTEGGFNATAVTALHGVTPVIWVNMGTSVVTLQISGFNAFTLYPSQNFTYVFPGSGTFHYDIFNTNYNGSVRVT